MAKGAGILAAIMSLVGLGGDEQQMDKDAQRFEGRTFHDFKVEDIDGNEVDLKRYEGEVCLVVNVASKCGLTPQYEGLQKVYDKYKDRGLKVLGFPSNDFMGQEPGTHEEIKTFCSTKYNVTFDLFAKVTVKGDEKCDLYAFLTSYPKNDVRGPVKWNFQKYLVGKDGEILAMFGPRTKPEDEKLIEAIEKALEAPAPKGEDKGGDAGEGEKAGE